MNDLSEFYRDWKVYKQQKKYSNKLYSTEQLKKHFINFETKNEGDHLIINHHNSLIDFWPSTGLFIDRFTKKRGRGIKRLLKEINSKIDSEEEK